METDEDDMNNEGTASEAEAERVDETTLDASESVEPPGPEVTVVVRYCGKQMAVSLGGVIKVDGPPYEEGVRIEEVLLATSDRTIVGNPTIDGAYVDLKFLDSDLAPKVINFKRRRRKSSSKRTKGYRSICSRYSVAAVNVPGMAGVEQPAAEPERATVQGEF